MTIDEAIQHCEEVAEKQDKLCEISVTERAKEQNSKCASEHRQLAEWLRELKAYREQRGDAISRQAAIDAVGLHRVPSHIKARIADLPSVTPQQRTGRWIKQNYGWNWQCSECGFVTPPSAKEIFTFCPNCGAKMEAE